MVVGISMFLLGLAVVLFMHKDFLLEHEISKVIIKKHRFWQGRVACVVMIIIGVAKIVAAVKG